MKGEFRELSDDEINREAAIPPSPAALVFAKHLAERSDRFLAELLEAEEVEPVDQGGEEE